MRFANCDIDTRPTQMLFRWSALLMFVGMLVGVPARGAVFPCDQAGILAAIAAGGGPHTFDCPGPTTVATSQVVVIDNDVILDGEGDLTLSGGLAHRVVAVLAGVTVELRNLTVTDGRELFGGGGGIINAGDLSLTDSSVVSNSARSGGGIASTGNLTLTRSIVSDNLAGFSAGGISFGSTNLIAPSPTLYLIDSTVSDNASGTEAGGVSVLGRLVATNSSIVRNVAANNTGAVLFQNLFGGGGEIISDATFVNSTISGNSAPVVAGGILNFGILRFINSTVVDNTGSTGITSDGELHLRNSVVESCFIRDVFFDEGFNVERGNTCRLTAASSMPNTDPMLGPLQDNGGPTPTHALLGGSPAIDAVPVSDCVDDLGNPLITDQRGVARPQGAACDIGAFEQLVLNMPPDCSGAVPDPGDQAWPPNHKFHDVSVLGVTDPDHDPVTITITSIAQDEPPEGTGDGSTCPDAEGVGTDVASVRAERSGPGDGRIYHIGFTAEDGQGGECGGTVTVCVPHDRGRGSSCVDDGPIFDSTVCEGDLAAAASAAGFDPGCGLGGFELAFLLPPLMWMRTQRRRRAH